MKTLFTMLAYCYIGRWLYLEACLLLPDIAPYLRNSLEILEPPTHDRIIDIIKSHSISDSIDKGIENFNPGHTRPHSKPAPAPDYEELAGDYF